MKKYNERLNFIENSSSPECCIHYFCKYSNFSATFHYKILLYFFYYLMFRISFGNNLHMSKFHKTVKILIFKNIINLIGQNYDKES